MNNPEPQTESLGEDEGRNAPGEKSYRMTPKGWLATKTGLFQAIEPVWEGLRNFVREQAAANGCTEGIPCLVFHEGGECVTVISLMPKARNKQ